MWRRKNNKIMEIIYKYLINILNITYKTTVIIYIN